MYVSRVCYKKPDTKSGSVWQNDRVEIIANVQGDRITLSYLPCKEDAQGNCVFKGHIPELIAHEGVRLRNRG